MCVQQQLLVPLAPHSILVWGHSCLRTGAQATCYTQTPHMLLLQVLQADGGTRCACINAAFMALADAGIPMRDMVAGCAVGYLQSTPLLDLNYMEDAGGGPDISVAVHPNLDRLVLLQVCSARVGPWVPDTS